MTSLTRRVGVDVGGTFTDFVELSADGLRAWKRLSTPDAPERSVLEGLPADELQVVHGSTVATNALLERRGPRTGLVVTEGFKDLLEIRRQMRPALYDLEPQRSPHVVARGDASPVRERLGPGGQVVIALDDTEVTRVVDTVRASGVEAVAICLLHSYANNDHERRLAEALRSAGLRVCASHEVSPEYREYERASTTAINVFLQDTVAGYLERLDRTVHALRVMHSGAGLTTTGEAAAFPSHMLLSGPAGGVLGAMEVARRSGLERIITFDMGGTSTDVALCDGAVPMRNSIEIDGLLVRTPMVDIETVGAGGGSIAFFDAGGALQVGPRSAGASPGPACYGVGTLPTVTDANLVLGRLRAEQRLGATLKPDAGRATTALATLDPEPTRVAAAVVQVVNASMARAVRRVSLERGHDPEDFTLVAFGGAGPLHACEVAEMAGVRRVLIPAVPGVLSALGMLTVPEAREWSHPMLSVVGQGPLAGALELESIARTEFAGAGHTVERANWAAEARYQGQAHELRVVLEEPTAEAVRSAFLAAHQRTFGFAPADRQVEIVTLRIRLEGPAPRLPELLRTTGESTSSSELPEGVVHRDDLRDRAAVSGPVVIVQDDATTYVPAGWRGAGDSAGNLLLEPGR